MKPNKRRRDWRQWLKRGDEVKWNDPDGGICSRSGTILEINYIADDVVAIAFTDGWQAEVLLKELS